jgi:hypothetical protein
LTIASAEGVCGQDDEESLKSKASEGLTDDHKGGKSWPRLKSMKNRYGIVVSLLRR